MGLVKYNFFSNNIIMKFTCSKKPLKTKSNNKKKSVKGNKIPMPGDISRFLEAQENGLNKGRYKKYKTDTKTVPLDRTGTGVNYATAIADLKDKKKLKKNTHYIWYVFPQPKKGSGGSSTTQFFFITENEVISFLNHRTTRRRLLKCLEALKSRNLNTRDKLRKYLSNVDFDKFSNFVNFFIEVIKKDTSNKIVRDDTFHKINVYINFYQKNNITKK